MLGPGDIHRIRHIYGNEATPPSPCQPMREYCTILFCAVTSFGAATGTTYSDWIACPGWRDVQRITHIHRRETSTSFPHRVTQVNRPAMFFRCALVWSRHWYHVRPGTLPHHPSSSRVYRNKPVGVYVGKNDAIPRPPKVTFVSNGRPIIYFLRAGPDDSPKGGHFLYATLSV